MNKLFAVMLGGAIGAALRYWLSSLPGRFFQSDFPVGTLLVNVLGAFLIGVLWVSAENHRLHPSLAPFLITGCLGALTTFSTFSLENMLLHEAGKTHIAALYIIVSVALGLAAVFSGAALARAFIR